MCCELHDGHMQCAVDHMTVTCNVLWITCFPPSLQPEYQDRPECISPPRRLSVPPSGLKPQTSSSSGFFHSQVKFVNQLWRESRLRVKHMLGTTGESLNYIEENTHIAYLCELLERVWGHGLKKREVRLVWGPESCREEV